MAQTSIRIRVPFHDVDSTGRIHFTAMFRYMEIAVSLPDDLRSALAN